MQTCELREKFLNFFASKSHKIIPSASIIPDDTSLLFTNSGMVPFKNIFLEKLKINFKRATSSQKCVRAGGKHNDLENVGFTSRHHTFFEMLGNFSFGDYFKEQAIIFAWEFITQILKLPKNKLYITVFKDDDESYDIWKKIIGIEEARIIRLGESSNFWQMADIGPCGPCSEIFYDHGPEVSGDIPGSENEDGDRFVEIWNLVFMQFEKNTSGELIPLSKPCVDTGMGLERTSAVMQGVHDNYDIDIFVNILQVVQEITGYNANNQEQLFSARIIADHIRASVFLIDDGLLPGATGAAYVLRRIIRRALRHGFKLKVKLPFFYQLVAVVVQEMGTAYPSIKKIINFITKIIKKEELQFSHTMETGIKLLNSQLASNKDKISGHTAFILYDTYGFPLDLTIDIAQEQKKEVDVEEYKKYMQEQQQRSRKNSDFKGIQANVLKLDLNTDFLGYEEKKVVAKVLYILDKNKQKIDFSNDYQQELGIITDKTCFYGESGGQIGDSGFLYGENSLFKVEDTQKQDDLFIHFGLLQKGEIRLGDELKLEIDNKRRHLIKLNHSATHLLHAALIKILGKHVEQKGSLVNAEKLRFDFLHYQALTQEELTKIELLVNQAIDQRLVVSTKITSLEEAKSQGAKALFSDKYSDKVRVLTIGDVKYPFSIELCGGTHVKKTDEIRCFAIIAESAISSGVRRIEAITAHKAWSWYQNHYQCLKTIANLVQSSSKDVVIKVSKLYQENKELKKNKSFNSNNKIFVIADSWLQQNKEEQGVILLIKEVKITNLEVKQVIDYLKNKQNNLVVFLINKIVDNQYTLFCGVSKGLSQKISANNIMKVVAPVLNGKGGGNTNFASGGGKNNNLKLAIKAIKQEVLNKG